MLVSFHQIEHSLNREYDFFLQKKCNTRENNYLGEVG